MRHKELKNQAIIATYTTKDYPCFLLFFCAIYLWLLFHMSSRRFYGLIILVIIVFLLLVIYQEMGNL